MELNREWTRMDVLLASRREGKGSESEPEFNHGLARPATK